MTTQAHARADEDRTRYSADLDVRGLNDLDDAPHWPVSGDTIAHIRHEQKNGPGASAKNTTGTAHNHPNPQQEDQMTTTKTTGTPPHPAWCVPARCIDDTIDIAHQAETRRFVQAPFGPREGITITSTLTRLEEHGYGYTTDPYLCISVDSTGGLGAITMNLTPDQVSLLADQLHQLAHEAAARIDQNHDGRRG